MSWIDQLLGAAAVEQARPFGRVAAAGDAVGRGEQADADRAEHAAHQVDRGRADRVVDLDLVEADHGEHDEHAGDRADDDRRRRR